MLVLGVNVRGTRAITVLLENSARKTALNPPMAMSASSGRSSHWVARMQAKTRTWALIFERCAFSLSRSSPPSTNLYEEIMSPIFGTVLPGQWVCFRSVKQFTYGIKHTLVKRFITREILGAFNTARWHCSVRHEPTKIKSGEKMSDGKKSWHVAVI